VSSSAGAFELIDRFLRTLAWLAGSN